MKAKENPYRVEQIHSLPFLFEEQDLKQFFGVVKDHNFRGAIVGPHGSGKTTLIENLIDEFRSKQIPFTHCRLTDDGRATNQRRIEEWITQSPLDSILILDSAGLLKWWERRSLLKRSLKYRGLVITTHRSGRLKTLINTQPRLETLIAIIDQLEIATPHTEKYLSKLFQKHRGNIRDCLRELYDEFARESGR